MYKLQLYTTKNKKPIRLTNTSVKNANVRSVVNALERADNFI